MSQNEREMKKAIKRTKARPTLFFSAHPPLPMSSILHNPISAHYYIASSFSHPFEQWDVIGQRLFFCLV